MKRIGIVLTMLVLIVGMWGCGDPTQYNLTVSSSTGGSVTDPGEGIYPYDEGTVVNLVAVADECYEFVNWTGDTVANPNSPTTTITIDAAKDVTANFAILSYDLSVNSTDGGSVTTPGEGIFARDCGTVVNLVATPDPDYSFVEWTGDIDEIDDAGTANTTITMNGDYEITANFFQGQLIRDWYDLDAVNGKLNGNYLLMNDLDSDTAGYEELASETADGGLGWDPIGTIFSAFTGAFDGQGYEISDLFINRPGENDIGLLAYVGSGGVVENIGVSVNITGGMTVGGLVGRNGLGTVSNSYSTGSVTGSYDVGGLVGYNTYSTVSNSYSTGSVTGNYYVGGLVGFNEYGTVSKSYSTGSVTGSGYHAGGLVGYSTSSTVSDSYSTGNVTGKHNVGGLAGSSSGTVSNSYSTGSVTGDDYVGGLVGLSSATVSNSFWDTETSGQATSAAGTPKTTAEMMDFDTFYDTGWDIVAVADSGTRDTNHIWNIVDDVTYPFLSWQS